MKEFDLIIGYDSIKAELKRTCDVLKNFDKYQALGVKLPAGILLYGDVGLGKTLMANCFVKATGWNVYTLRKDKPNGDFVKEITKIYNEASNNQPAIVLLDDLDKYSNEDRNHRNSDEFITVQSCIDASKGKKVFTFATANSQHEFPDSLLRAGRFDKLIEVEKPQSKDRKKIIEYYLSQKKLADDLDYDEIAKILDGESCAKLETVINEAGIYAGGQNKQAIDMDDIIRACLRVIFDAPESMSDSAKANLEITAYHEAGHAVVGEILEPNSINLISVMKYDGNCGGVTSYSTNDSYFYDKKHMENRVKMVLAGKAATEIVFGKVDVGANSDLHRAFNIVERFVDNYCSYGFDKFESRRSSNDLLSRKDNCMAYEMEKYYQQAKDILMENRQFLDVLAQELLKNKTIRLKRFQEIKQSIYGNK